jgi:hypothetical protein
MATRPKFLQKNGLTQYSLACGNLQIARISNDTDETTVRLEQDSACWHVKVSVKELGRVVWESFSTLGEARKHWSLMVRSYLGFAIRTARADKRYAVAQEYTGRYEEPQWVVRFEGEFVVARDNEMFAWASAYDHRAGMQAA